MSGDHGRPFSDIRRGTLLWWALAVPLVVLGVVAMVVDSVSLILIDRPTRFPIFRLLLGYVVGGALAGCTQGVLWAKVGNVVHAMGVGLLAAVPFFLAIRVAMLGPFQWTLDGVLGLGARSLIGVVAGFVLWRHER